MMPGTGHADSATAIDGRHTILSLNLRVVLAGLPIRMAMATTVALVAAILAAPPILAQSSISPPAYALINSRTSQNQTQFYIYSDMDSGFNHGFPSGLFGNAMGKLTFTPNCVYAPTLPSGCATDPTVLDQARGTVFQFVFQSMPSGSGQFVGLNFEEPQNLGVLQQGNGYDLTGATKLTFWARGETGDEVVAFKFGLIGREKKFFDSASGALEKVKLSRDWKQYTLDLKGKDLKRIKTGFCWVVAAEGQPVTFYLDDIRYE